MTDTSNPLSDLTAAARWTVRGVTAPGTAALNRPTALAGPAAERAEDAALACR